MKSYQYVIIGGSIAAVAAIEGIRSEDREGSILVIGEEKHVAYGRPLISYYLLGETTLPRMDYRPADFYEKNKVECMLGVRAAAIHPEEKTVELVGGEKVGYEKLLAATGSRPFEPPMQGIESVKERFSFMTMDDMLALERALSPEKRVLIVGAGLIGLKCFEGIAARVKHTAIVDLAPRILPSILDETGAKMVQRVLESAVKKGLLVAEGDGLRLPSHTVSLADDQQGLRQKLLAAHEAGGMAPPNLKDVLAELNVSQKDATPVLRLLCEEKALVRVADGLYYAAGPLEEILSRGTGKR